MRWIIGLLFLWCSISYAGDVVITGGGAPTDADYLVGTANGTLSAEIVVGTSPGVELGGTWASPTIDDSLAVTSWNLTTPTITTSLTTSTPTTLTAAELDRLDGLTSAIIDDDKIDTYTELNTIVADVTLTHNGFIDTFSELDAIVADKSLVETTTAFGGDVSGTIGATVVANDSHDHSAAGSTVTINATDIVDLNAGTDLTADLEEEVTAGRSLTKTVQEILADAELYTDFKSITIETPTDADNFFMFEAPLALTITRIHGIVEDVTSVVMTFQECDSAGDNAVTIESITADINGTIVTSGDIDNAGIDAGDIIRVDVGTVTGTVGQVNVTITFTKDD